MSVTQESVVTAWREMSACHAAACAALERELGERHGLGISDFEVLERLAESDGRKFRAQDLAEAVHLSQKRAVPSGRPAAGTAWSSGAAVTWTGAASTWC